MADDDGFLSEEPGQNTMLREAIEALRQGNRPRARDLLTRLLKTDQDNPQYWLWLSAAVETQKEKVFCLQRALQGDPQNASARRGLVLLGGLPPDDSVPPFPLDRPRLWEEKLKAPPEPKEKTRVWANPLVRISAFMGIAIFVIGGLFIGRSFAFPARVVPTSTATRRPTMTVTFTPTITPAVRTATPTFLGPTPLWMFLVSTYTPTPLYVITPHPALSSASYEAGLRSLAMGNYDVARLQFEGVLNTEPDAVDAFYYIGESYRLQGDYRSAKEAYQEAINRNANFAPAYLGRARANMGLNRTTDVLNDLNGAVNLDGNFAEAYIARGAYTVDSNPAAAKKDLEIAIEITPDSALAYLNLAQAELNLGENQAALESAIRAKDLDMTLVPVYLVLAQAYIETGQTSLAVSVLQTYTVYRPDDVNAFVKLGTAFNASGDYEAAISVLTKAIEANKRNAEAYFQRGSAYLILDNPNLAESDFKLATAYDPRDFDSFIGLARSYFNQGMPGDAYIVAYQKAQPLARTDLTKAQVYYWEALFLEATGKPQDAIGAQNCWNSLIGLPADVMPEEWRTEAFQHLDITPTYTATLTSTRTPTKTPTPRVTSTPTKTP